MGKRSWFAAVVRGGEGVDAAEEFVEAIACELVVDMQAAFFAAQPAGLTHQGEVLRNG